MIFLEQKDCRISAVFLFFGAGSVFLVCLFLHLCHTFNLTFIGFFGILNKNKVIFRPSGGSERIISMKKFVALLLVAIMAVSVLSACTDKEKELSYAITATVNGEEVRYSAGPYRYYLQWTHDYYYSYLSTLYSKSGKTMDWSALLESTAFSGTKETLSQTIVKEAKELYMLYLYVQETFDDVGLTLSAEDEAAIDKLIQNDFVGVYGNDKFNTIRQTLGLSYDEFRSVVGTNIKSERLVEYFYGENGVQAISQAEKKDYFKNNYARFKYVIKMTVDSDGNEYSKTKVEEVRGQIDAAVAELNAGVPFEDVLVKYSEDYNMLTDDMTVSEKEAYELQNKTMLEDGLIINEAGVFSQNLATYYGISVDADVVDKVFSLKIGEYATVTIDDSIWIVKRYDHMEKESYYTDVENAVYSSLYSEDLSSKHTAWTQSLNYTYNEKLLETYKPETLTDLFDFANAS